MEEEQQIHHRLATMIDLWLYYRVLGGGRRCNKKKMLERPPRHELIYPFKKLGFCSVGNFKQLRNYQQESYMIGFSF